MTISIGSKISLLYGISFFILFFVIIELLSLNILGYILLVILGAIEGLVVISITTIITFVFGLFYFGRIVEENILKKRSLLYTSLTFSFSINTVIWLSVLTGYIILLLFSDQLGSDIEDIGKSVLIVISIIVAIFSIFTFSILTALSIGLIIVHRVKNALMKSSLV